MKKILCALISALMLISLCACGNKTDNGESTKAPDSSTSEPTSSSEPASSAKDIDLSEIKERIIKEVNVEEPMSITTEKLNELYGIEADDVAQSACFVTSNGTFPEEAIMIKAKDSAAKQRIADLLNTRIEDVKVQSESYDADNYAIAQKCKVIRQGDYIAMFISASHEKMESIFSEAVK
ncbi:MAG: DUF4358 domain-containing protein [Acutalibacteraceae bacterium]